MTMITLIMKTSGGDNRDGDDLTLPLLFFRHDVDHFDYVTMVVIIMMMVVMIIMTIMTVTSVVLQT